MRTREEKGRAFRELHEREGAFILPNPWDVGSARLLSYLGFEALATTSMGYAFSIGRLDGSLTREETLAHVGVPYVTPSSRNGAMCRSSASAILCRSPFNHRAISDPSCVHGRYSGSIARRSSVARWASATVSRGMVRSKT